MLAVLRVFGRHRIVITIPSQKETPARVSRLCCLIMALALSACAGPPALHRAVLSYDETISRLESEMLLLNVARLQAELPPHFTVTSSVAATFNWTVSGGMLGRFDTGPVLGNMLDLTLGASASENPTFSIVPVTGREFTERFLTPLQDKGFEFVVFQGTPIDRVMRLAAGGIEIQKPDGSFDRFILNSPSVRDEYEEFRRIVMHLIWLNDTRKLFVRTLLFEQTLTKKPKGEPPTVDEITKTLDKKLIWRQAPDGSHLLIKKVAGRVAVTNYDPNTLGNQERHALNNLADRNPSNFVLLDIRPGYPGGDWPMFGGIKLRSFAGILAFVASSIRKNPEFAVDKDRRTGKLRENPTSSLAIQVTDSAPDGDMPWVNFSGRYYSVGDTEWDRKSFALLSVLFQTTVTDVSGVGIPITISK